MEDIGEEKILFEEVIYKKSVEYVYNKIFFNFIFYKEKESRKNFDKNFRWNRRHSNKK